MVSFIVMSLFAWRDLDWRIKNIEKWQAKHIIDEGARDLLIAAMDDILKELRWQTGHMLGRKGAPPPSSNS